MRHARSFGAGLLLLALGGCSCGGGSGSNPAPNTGPGNVPAPTPGTPSGGGGPAEKPRIDVIVQRLDVPPRANREQEIELTIEVKNNNLSGPSAGVTNVTVRATLRQPTGGVTDVPLGGTQFRDLRPQESKSRTIRVRAPHMTGLWTVRVLAEPSDYRDDVNNTLEKPLAVD